MIHIFPETILLHTLTMSNGGALALLVDASETYGHALARAGIQSSDVESVAWDMPAIYYQMTVWLHVKPDHNPASHLTVRGFFVLICNAQWCDIGP